MFKIPIINRCEDCHWKKSEKVGGKRIITVGKVGNKNINLKQN